MNGYEKALIIACFMEGYAKINPESAAELQGWLDEKTNSNTNFLLGDFVAQIEEDGKSLIEASYSSVVLKLDAERHQ
jgi:hypothetical protein